MLPAVSIIASSSLTLNGCPLNECSSLKGISTTFSRPPIGAAFLGGKQIIDRCQLYFFRAAFQGDIERDVWKKPFLGNVFLSKRFQDHILGFVCNSLPIGKGQCDSGGPGCPARLLDIDDGEPWHGNGGVADVPHRVLPCADESVLLPYSSLTFSANSPTTMPASSRLSIFLPSR